MCTEAAVDMSYKNKEKKNTRLTVVTVFMLLTLLIIVLTGRTESKVSDETASNAENLTEKKDKDKKPEKLKDETYKASSEDYGTEKEEIQTSESDPDETSSLSHLDSEDKELSPSNKQKHQEKDTDGFLRGKILPGKGIESALLALEGVELKHAMAVSNVLRFNFDMRYLIAGEDIKIKLSNDKNFVEHFEYQPNAIVSHVLVRDKKTEKLLYHKEIKPHEIRYRIIEGQVENTLNSSLASRDDVTANIRSTANNVLGCIVSFRTDARNGDRYKILVEENFRNNEKAGRAKILYLSYEGIIAKKSEAFLYEDNDPESAFNAHYTMEGKALIPSSLRLPVDRVRVTSPFGYRRHPVTGRRSFHNGVDYGGAIGAPVYAIAEGRIIQTTRTTYGGKKIVIRHLDGTQSYYLHLHRIMVPQGRYVKAREQIGQIGRTGRVTGAHLHLGIKSSSGKWQDPLRKKMIATPRLKSKRMKRYRKQKSDIQKIIDITETYQTMLAEMEKGPQSRDFLKRFEEYYRLTRRQVNGSIEE